ncbi:MAG: hypothetical protein F6K30_30815 [Cyanothece sp. SIO2G6]|nr:hypothetical protein [Cyanothece sp. SIO2G6]
MEYSLFDLNIEITDLPVGQLAEATITCFDTNGHPIAGIILIDDDANGLGWFIDLTPWAHSEFQSTHTATRLSGTLAVTHQRRSHSHYETIDPTAS